MKNIVIIGAIAVVVLAGIYFFMQSDDVNMDEVMNGDETADEMDDTDTNTSAGGNNSGAGPENNVVLAENETGNFATIASATFTQQGFVAIYKVDSQGKTTLIGNTDLLEAGTHSNISVQLDSIVAKEETIVAVMHADDGDGEFEFPESDFYLNNSTSAFVADVDVVDVDFADEEASLQAQVETYLEASAEANDPEVQ
ncbi:MAG: hypothetical protein WDZ93_00015 [Candidatus Paceibacterota bacterium]